MKKINIFTIIMILSGIIFFFFTSEFINNFVQCETAEWNSFPCYGLYWVYAKIFAVILFVIWIIWSSIINKKNK